MISAPAVDSETLLLSVTRHLLSHTTPAALCKQGLQFLTDALAADLAMLHIARHDDFHLAAHVGEHPLLHVHDVQALTPAWRKRLLAGHWHCQPLPTANWEGPPEQCYSRLDMQYLACFGLHSGNRLIGYVGLLFHDVRHDLERLTVLGAIGALWGALLERLETEAALHEREATLRTREAMLRSVTDRGTDSLTILDGHGNVTYQSAGISRMIGWPAETLLQRGIFTFVHPEDISDVRQAFTQVTQGPPGSVELTYRYRHQDGRYVWIESRARNPLADPDVHGIVVHSADVTDRVRLQQDAQRRLRELATLHEVGVALRDCLDVRELCGRVVRVLSHTIGYEIAAVMRVTGDRIEPVVAWRDGNVDPRSLHPQGEPPPSLHVTQGLMGAALASSASVSVADVRTDPRYVQYGDDIRAQLVTPVFVHGRAWGLLSIESVHLNAYGDADRTTLETVAAQLGSALANALYVEELRDAYDQTITGWARALDYRDHETEGHSQRVTELTVQLARRIDVPHEQLVHLRRGALLHDIGKMGIPDSVLLKPGALSDDEWAVMRMHPTMAHELLCPIGFLEPALDIPLAHHEKWDGSGYPRGLHGEQIPLAARIFAVVDVWDALRSDRPYRPAWSAAQARTHIEAQSGSHFDPAVVRVFLELLDERDRTER